MKCRIGFSSNKGPRDRNEDNGLAMQASIMGEEVVLLGVCDGMGGDANGERAATEVTTDLSGFLAYLSPSVFKESDLERAKQVLKPAIRKWSHDVVEELKQVAERDSLRGLTTTLVACLMWGNQLAVWWLGDSRAYRFRDGRLERLTMDHSKVEQTLGLAEDEALEHQERNKVSRFFRPLIQWSPDTRFFDWKDGDVLLLTSDGVSGSCRSWELEAFVAYWLAADITPELLCKQVLRYIRNNQQDNATIAIAMRGTPKPFAENIATVALPTFVRYGLKQAMVDLLTSYPKSSPEWQNRTTPLWRMSGRTILVGQQLSTTDTHGFEESRIVGKSEALDKTTPIGSLCLTCGCRVAPNQACPDHGQDNLWRGFYMEVVAPSGKITYHSLQKNKTLLVGNPDWPATDLELTGDEMVSMAHSLFTIDEQGIHLRDQDSDNGTWLRIRNVQLMEPGWLEEGITVLVGQHQLTVYTTDRPVREPQHGQQIIQLGPVAPIQEPLANEPENT